MKKIIFLFFLITLFFLSHSFSYAGAPPTATSCPVCPSGFIWNNAYNTCQDSKNPTNYQDPTNRVNCSASGSCCTNAVDGTCSATGYCSSNPAPVPAPQNVYNCANRDPKCSTSSYPNCKDVPYSYLYNCAPPYCVMHNLSGSNNANWTTSCSWANGQPEPYSAPPPSTECDPSKDNSCGNGAYACLPDVSNQKFTCQPGTQQDQFNQIPCVGNSCKTALGDFSTDPSGFISRVFGLILSISGGIALLLIIISGYKVLSSQGNPETLKGAREQLTAAIVGLLFIILSLVILQIIGYDILRIPAFK